MDRPQPEDLESLYRRAFAEYGTRALWNMRPVDDPTPADACTITQALRTHGRMDGRRLAERIERFAVPISKFQSEVLRHLAAQRSPDSDIPGGIAINRHGPRFSNDIDIFHDSVARQEGAVKADETALAAAGYSNTWPPAQRTGKHKAIIAKGGERMQLSRM